MCCFSDLLLLKEYIKIVSNVKGLDPKAAGMLIPTLTPGCAE